MWVSRGGFPIGLPFGGCHRGTTPQRAPGRKRRAVKVVRVVAGRVPSAPGRKPGSDAHHPPACAKTKPGAQRAKTPQRAPRRKPGSGASTEPSIGPRNVNRAKHQVPRAAAEPSSEFPRRRIVVFVRPWSKLTILRSLKAKTHDYLRYRKAQTRTTGKNVHFPLPRPRKTVCFDRQRPKQTVFHIAHPQGEGHSPPGWRGSRHRGGKTAQNWEAQRRSEDRSPRARVTPPGRGRGPQGKGHGPPGRGRGAELEGLMQTTRNQARLPLHVGTVNRAQTATRAGGKPV